MKATASQPSVAVLADDLIWGSRLGRFVEAAGGSAKHVRTLDTFEAEVGAAALAIVDATARAYEPLTAIRAAHAQGVRVVCLAQHDDASLRRAALDAGAERVIAYRTMAERGPALVSEWLGQEAD